MITRTRGSLITKRATSTLRSRWYTYMDGPFNWRRCYPMIMSSQSYDSSPYTVCDLESIQEDSSGKDAFNNCIHTKRIVPEPPALTGLASLSNVWGIRQGYFSDVMGSFDTQLLTSVDYFVSLSRSYDQAGFGLDVVYGDDKSLAIPGYTTHDRLGELPKKVINRIDQLALANSLYELKDMPDLYRSFIGRRSLVNQSLKVLRDLRSRYRNVPAILAQLIKLYREGQLAWTFGIMPTVQDCVNIAKAAKKGIKIPDGASVTIRESKQWSNVGRLAPSWPVTESACYIDKDVTDVWGCRIKILENKNVSESMRNLERKIDALVGHNPAAIIWEALPFSWCVDWLVSVDSILDNIYLNSNPMFQVQYWTSHKLVAKRRIEMKVMRERVWGMKENPSGPWDYERVDYDGGEHTQSYSGYSRVACGAPNPLKSARFRLTPQKAWIGLLVALGFLL